MLFPAATSCIATKAPNKGLFWGVTFWGSGSRGPSPPPNSSLPLVSTWGASPINQGVLWCHWLIIKVKFCGYVRSGTGGQRVKGEGGLPKHPHMCFAQPASSFSSALPSLHFPCSWVPPPLPISSWLQGAAQGPGVRVCPHFSSSSSLASGSSSDLSSSL